MLPTHPQPTSPAAFYRILRACILIARQPPQPNDAAKLQAAMNSLINSPNAFSLEDAEKLIKGWVEHPERYSQGEH